MMNPYIISLAVLVVLTVGLARGQQTSISVDFNRLLSRQRYKEVDDELHDLDRDSTLDKFASFRHEFLMVYVCATAADWLQVSLQ